MFTILDQANRLKIIWNHNVDHFTHIDETANFLNDIVAPEEDQKTYNMDNHS